MADMPKIKTRDMFGEAVEVVKAHQRIREDIAARAQELQNIRDQQMDQKQSDEIVMPYGS